MDAVLARLASRKFILSILALGASAWLCWSGHISDGVYSAVVLGTVGAYITGNVIQRVNLG